MKRITSLLMVLFVTLGAMAQTNPVTTKYDFEDGVKLFTDDSRITSSIVEGLGYDGSNALLFKCAGNAQNGYSFAHFDFSSLMENPKSVTINLQYYNTNGGRAILSIGDASVRGTTGNSTKTTYSNKGTIFALGSEKSNAYINGAKPALATFCNKWLDVTVSVNILESKYSYSIKDMGTQTELEKAENVAYFSSDALSCTQIDLFGYINNSKCAKIDNISITVEEDVRAYADYKVTYVDENGNVVKESATYSGVVGEAIALIESDKAPFKNSDNTKKYIYKSDDAMGKTVASDGSTVVVVIFREAEFYNYIVNAVDGDKNELKVIVDSSYFEGEIVTIPYSQYVLEGEVLYETDKNTTGAYYNKSIELSSDEMTFSVVYDKDTINNVVYFSEAEEIKGMTSTTASNANARCSNAAGAYNATDESVVVTTLSPGVYVITAQVWGNAGTNFNIVCGDSTLVVSTEGYILSGSKEFTVNEPTEVTIPKAGDSGKCIDWIYIQEKDPTLTTYTVKYVDEAGNELKEASVYDILPGDTASIKPENKEIIIVGDKRYGYDKCDHDTIVAVPSADMNVITATFRELVKYSYTVNAVDKANNKLKVVADTSDFEGTTVTVPYNQYILVDDVLYAAPAIDKQYNKYITLASDTIVPIVYEASSIDRVVYFSEAENIEGMTATTSGNANIRCSNGTGAYNGSDDPVVVTTLTPGIYTIAAQIWGGSKNADSQVHFNIVCGGDTLVVTTTGSITTGSKEFVVNEDSQVRILRAGDRNKSIDWIYIQEKDPALTTYTVKYVDEAGNELKEASVYDILPGDTAFIMDENMEAILKGDKKYAYKSCDKDTIVAVPSAELNVFIATFRELAKYSYTVDAVDEAGNELKVIADTSDFEGTVTVPYNQYILVNDVLYVASADNQQYNKYVTLASDTAMSIVYKESSIDNIVYFSEAEDIEGMTATTSGYANVRCSKGTGAYNASDDPVVVTTLAPGAYTIAAQVWGNAGVHFNIVCGGDTLVVSTTGSITTGSKEFVVNEESQVTILRAGDRNKSIDWIYIQDRELIIADNGSDFNAVGPYSNVSYTRDIAADTYATICLPFAPDAASLENYNFFTLESVDEGILNFVEETAPVANTPYIYCLKEGKTATAITGGITVVSNELNDVVVGDWTMKGSFTNQSFDTSAADVKYYGYVSGENIVVKSDDTFAVEPYRAYFTSSVDVADMYLRIISSDDEATEITTADLDVQKPVVIYDLAGRRVEKMDKGIYIVNGKKVVK